METFEAFFERASNMGTPYDWQRSLAAQGPENRLVRIPTGFGKTLGVLSAWLWHRVQRHDERWPRRLVWCLPMRVLVEQTRDEAEAFLRRLELLWDGSVGHRAGKVGVHLLMGGLDGGDWHIYPEHEAVLIGTQDMLLSRAMNRGYAAPRARWPMEFGLLNQDCLWVMDEVQLMDVGLATSGQLQAFREEDAEAGKTLRPCFTWWMSATLQREWLTTSPDIRGSLAELPASMIEPASRNGHLWDDVSKPIELLPAAETSQFARLIADKHLESGSDRRGLTLVVMNTVERAVQVAEAVNVDKRLKGSATDVRLIHSRFRPAERAGWREDFLNKRACVAGADRIVIATQVVEAGVDISAHVLITELAPWASLVQRFGRCARWGGTARVFIVDSAAKDDKAAAPYTKAELDAAREALTLLSDASPLHLEMLEAAHPDWLAALYPYDPLHLLLRHELNELFDTTPDLSGADIDISRFIRSGEERDVQVFWADVPEKKSPPPDLRPFREGLCAVPFLKARDWLCGRETSNARAPRLKKGMRAWVWDWLEGQWKVVQRRDLYPGRTVLVAAACGGYDRIQGWNPGNTSLGADVVLTPVEASAAERADDAQDDESLSAYPWQTIATHGGQTGAEAAAIATMLVPQLADIFHLSGRWHDAGKVHPAFNGSMVGPEKPGRPDLAKAPKHAWLRGRKLYPMPDGTHRPGFRHELASVLALFGVLQRFQPDHPALLGPWRELLEKAGMPPLAVPRLDTAASPLEREILALDAPLFNLVCYLICTHHGKVRLAWHGSPGDQIAVTERLRIHGIEDGEPLPGLIMPAADGSLHFLPETALDLAPSAAGLNPHTGPGWTERVLGLLDRHGPFTLAWLEALLRAADQRASRKPILDPLLEKDDGQVDLAGGDRTLAKVAGRGETRHPLEDDSAQCGGEHGLRGRTGGSGDVGSGTRPPTHATRFVETRLGFLSYTQLAPYLGRAVGALEARIESGEFDSRCIDEVLIEELHGRICADLCPQLAGWRRINVVVGAHIPVDFYLVPMRVREYARDLEARLAALRSAYDENLLETLAFAEGRLLSIHPFADFNGRLTRVVLRLLLRRLDLPWAELLPQPGGEPLYLAALSAADRDDWRPLMAVWRERFEQEVSP